MQAHFLALSQQETLGCGTVAHALLKQHLTLSQNIFRTIARCTQHAAARACLFDAGRCWEPRLWNVFPFVAVVDVQVQKKVLVRHTNVKPVVQLPVLSLWHFVVVLESPLERCPVILNEIFLAQ